NSIVFHIEEDAYEILRSYMIEVKRHFGNSEDSREILEDIENSIAEMFSERIQTCLKEVINREDVDQVMSQMGRGSSCGTAIGEEPRMESEPRGAFADQAENAGHFQTEQQPAQEEGQEHQAEPSCAEYLISKKLMRDMD